MQQRALWIISGLGGVLLITLSVGWFLLTHERVDQLQAHPWSKAARDNPYLAAERLLTRLGQPARSLRSLSELPNKLPSGKHDLLLLSTPSFSLGEAQRSALLEWVSNGGHLLLAPQRFVDAEPKHGSGGDTASGSGTGSGSSADAELATDTEAEPSDLSSGDELLDTLRILPRKVTLTDVDTESHPANVTLPATATAQPLKIRFEPRQSLIDLDAAAHWRVADATTDAHLIQLAWGKGWITVLSDLDWLNNTAISQHDHAAFWWRIVGSTKAPPPTVWLQYLPEAPPWWDLLRETAAPLLIAGSLWLLLHLLRLATRFGPLLPRPDPARRSLLEHIRATGYWLWQRQAAQELLEAQRHALRRQLLRRHPNWAALTPAAQITYLAQLSGLPALRVESALAAATTTLRPREFVQKIEDLRRLGHDV